MYVDLIVFILLVIAVVVFFRNFSSFVYFVVIMDILYRLLHFLSDNLKVPELTALIDKYVPKDVVGLIGNYIGTKGIFYTILIWFMFFMYCIFLFYIIRTFVKKHL